MFESWPVIVPSEESTRCKNPIRSFIETEVSKVVVTSQKKRINLTLGDPAGSAEFKISPQVSNLLDIDFEQSCRKTSFQGEEISRNYIAKLYSTDRWNLTKDDVFLTQGGSACLWALLNLFADSGDTILAAHPGFPLIFALCENRGVNCVLYKLADDENSSVDLTDLEKKIIEHKPKFLLVNNPSNPLGTVWEANHIEDILSLTNKYQVPVVADEMYEKMVYGGAKPVSFGTKSRGQPVFVFSGLSKMCLAPGWRCGWIVCYGDEKIIAPAKHGLRNLSQMYSHPNRIASNRIPEIFEASLPIMDEKMALVEKKSSLIKENLKEFSEIRIANTKGALYLGLFLDLDKFDFDNTKELTLKLLAEENIFVLPGEAFKAKNMIRLVLMSTEKEIEDFTQRFKSFIIRHRLE